MGGRIKRWRAGWLLALAAVAGLSGCSTSGGRLTLFPEGHRLIDSAKVLREVSSPPPGTPHELDKRVAGPYTVEPGDVLLAQPASLDSPIRLPGDQPVLPDGTIQLGRYGRLFVAGKPVELIEAEANELIKAKVADAGPIIVRLVTRDSKVYYVLGEVNAPGSFSLKGRETVLDAIVSAGGLTTNAQRKGIILVRPTAPDSCRVVLPVWYNTIVQLGDTKTNYQIKAGDRVYIPSKTLWDDIAACFHKHAGTEPMPWPCHSDGDSPVMIGSPVELPGPMLRSAATIGPVFTGKPGEEPLPPPRPSPQLSRPELSLP
jgi:protein involved in polysaccharide export with SLBB domain